MEYSKLGNTDIEVSKLCVGCMSFGKAGTMHDWTLDESESEKIIKHALNLGYNFFDTANGYSAGTSEEYLGRVLKKNIARDVGEKKEIPAVSYNTLFFESANEGQLGNYFLKFRKSLINSNDRNAVFIDEVANAADRLVFKAQEVLMMG